VQSKQSSFAWIVVTALILAACMPSPAPQISSLSSDPKIAHEGGPVDYAVRYRNTSEEGTFSEAVLTVFYDRYLKYEKASPQPDVANIPQRELYWEIGDMKPGEEGTIEIAFTLSAQIPLAVYELEVEAEIASVDAEGNTVTRSRSGVTLIEGHPTPTPTPTYTPKPVTPTGTPPTSAPQPRVTSTPVASSKDCVAYDPKALQIVSLGDQGYRLVENGSHGMLSLDDKVDAYDALALAQRHTRHCFIGRDNTRADRLDYIIDYWEGDSGIETVIEDEDCLYYDASALRIVDQGKNGWLLTDGRSSMALLDDEQDAQAALELAKQFKYHCFIGRGNDRPDPAAYIVEYWK
jgi:hypothetical protein